MPCLVQVAVARIVRGEDAARAVTGCNAGRSGSAVRVCLRRRYCDMAIILRRRVVALVARSAISCGGGPLVLRLPAVSAGPPFWIAVVAVPVKLSRTTLATPLRSCTICTRSPSWMSPSSRCATWMVWPSSFWTVTSMPRPPPPTLVWLSTIVPAIAPPTAPSRPPIRAAADSRGRRSRRSRAAGRADQAADIVPLPGRRCHRPPPRRLTSLIETTRPVFARRPVP